MDSRRKSSPDRYLIAEQPGLTVLFSGLILSFFLGYTAKSLFSPSRVAARIEKAASQIHKDVRVSFSSAQFSLSDGIFPRLAVVISQVKMESMKKCWGAPVLEVDELRLPLSLANIFGGKAPLRKIEANKVQVTLRENIQDCEKQEVTMEEKKVAAPLVSLSPKEQSNKYQNALQSLSVQELKIVVKNHPPFDSEFFNLKVEMKSFEPKIIEVTTSTHLLKDWQVGDYLSHANLYVQYRESPQAKIQSHFFGNWREGHYSIIGNYTLDEKLLAVEADLKHIPLSQILAILQKYNLASKELNGRQAWISSKARIEAPVDQLKRSPLEIRDLLLEGDLGELKADHINVKSIEPLRYSPIVVDIKKLNVSSLLVLLNRPNMSNMLGELGVFSGRADIESENKMRMTGEHRGLEFVFSNKGQRELQVIDHMVGDVELAGDRWGFKIDRIKPRGGTFIGEVKVKADRDFHDVEFKTRVDEVSFAPAVQTLMTNGGSVGALTLDVDARLKNGLMSYLKGAARIEGMNVEGLGFGKTKINIDWADGEVVLKNQIKSLKIEPTASGIDVIKQVTNPTWWNNGSLTMTDLSGVFSSKNLKILSWKNVQGQIGKTGKFMSEGSWSEDGRLAGSISNRENKNHKKWRLQGSRENPVFIEEAPTQKTRK